MISNLEKNCVFFSTICTIFFNQNGSKMICTIRSTKFCMVLHFFLIIRLAFFAILFCLPLIYYFNTYFSIQVCLVIITVWHTVSMGYITRTVLADNVHHSFRIPQVKRWLINTQRLISLYPIITLIWRKRRLT